MPETEYTKWSQDSSYQPRTLLLDEVLPGEKYVLIPTNFLGGAYVRYFLGDVIQITSLRNEKLNINLPQMSFYSRADNVLDFAGASLTEKAIWQAIENTGFSYVDWVARKENSEGPILHIYIEMKDERLSEKEIAAGIDKQLRLLKADYEYMVGELNFKLLKLTLLPKGAFQTYIAMRQAAGADPAHMKPPHISPSEDAMAALLGPRDNVTVKV
jgi:hypothetical protein